MPIECEFLGGGHEVGRLGILMKTGKARVLFDYGMSATDPPKYPAPAPALDMMFLTHSHLDHCGMIPWVTARYDVDVVATTTSKKVGELLMEDSIKVAASEGYPEMYGKTEVKQAMRRFRDVEFGDTATVNSVQVRIHSAGHIPGATMYEVMGKETTLVTGDLHTLDTRLVAGAKPVKCNNLIMESTYSGRNHPDRLKTEYQFLKKVHEVVDRGGKAIVPAFAVGRTQEILLLLKDSKLDYWHDGMGKSVNKLYLSEPQHLRSAKRLRQAVSRGREVKNFHARQRAHDGEVIVTTSGMLDGGPVVNYIEGAKDDPKSAILMTGYQVEGSNGRKLLDTGTMEFHGVVEKVHCEVMKFDFSAHAGHDDLVEFAKGCSPEKVVLCHGDHRDPLAEDLRKEGFEVLLPMNGDKFEL